MLLSGTIYSLTGISQHTRQTFENGIAEQSPVEQAAVERGVVAQGAVEQGKSTSVRCFKLTLKRAQAWETARFPNRNARAAPALAPV